jgi:ESX secretion system protein EccC
MSTVQFRRLPRLAAPKMPGGEVHLEAPPEVPRVLPGNILQKILPIVMIVAVLGMVGYTFTTGDGKSNPLFLMFPIMMVVSTIGMFAGGSRGGQAKAEMNADRKDYLRYPGQMRERAREAAREQRAALEWSHPDPAALWSIASGRRMWERRGGDLDFATVRICRGSQRLATRLVAPQTGPVDELEPITTLALRQFVRAHSIVPELPIAISVRGFAAIGISGEPVASRGLARSMVVQLATFHSPDDLLVAVVTTGRAKLDWEWAKWLPHAQHPSHVDGVGPVRMMAGSLARTEELLAEQLRDRPRFSRSAPPPGDGPQILIVVDGGEVTGAEQILLEEGLAGVTLLDLSGSLGALTGRRGLPLAIEGGQIGARGATGVEFFGVPDSLTVAEAEAVARTLSPFRLGTAESHGDDTPLLGNTGLLGLLGLLGLPEDPHAFDVAQAWRPRPVRDRLRVPIGLGEFGQPVELDIKEAAQGGMGPHGLCVGATGSGKSEFLRTLVLGLIATHSSAALNLVLVDFKGGATFLGMEGAPHVAAVITNLADDLTQVSRMHDALAGEMNRRQELLRTAGNFANVKDYEKARDNGADLDPLPALFIVIDEFSELLAQRPEFIDLFVAIGRLGRSLQMHLLLASQRLEEGRLRGLESHLSYRIGLKTFSAGDSRAVLGVSDAYELPSAPGSGYLKFDTASMERFKAAYVSGPYRVGRVVARATSAPIISDLRLRLFVPDYVDLPELAAPSPEACDEPPEKVSEPSVLDIVVAKLRGQGPPAHEVWLPPLEAPPSLDQLLPPLSITEDRGLSPIGFFGNGRLAVPVGIVDKPYEQRRDLLWADFSGAAGHAAVTGGPQSGKSTLLRAVLMSLALTHTPDEVQFFCIDFGGGTLASLDSLPHSGGVAGRLEPDTIRRIIAEIAGLLAAREQRFRTLGIDSMADFRARKQRGELGEDPFGDVFLVIDGWHSFRQEFEVSDLEMRVVNLATQGLSYGVHVLIGATRWAEIRPAMKDLLGTRFELRLGDPGESDIDRNAALNVPPGRPGRGLSRDKLHFLAALPRIDAVTGAQDVGAGVADAVARIRDGWPGHRAPRVRLLPERIPYSQLRVPEQRPHLIPIGINEAELATVSLDFTAEPHFLCFGDSECGKTNLLRTIARGIVDRCAPEQARIIMVDYRRTMLGFLESEHLIGYGMSTDVLTPIISDVAKSMRARLPGAGVTQQQLRDRSWWSGPQLYVLVDDYDLVAAQGGVNPLAPLLEFLAQAKDVGLHLIIARRCGGAARALFEPVSARLRELSTPGIVMSGNPDEGPLLGNVTPVPMPPGRGTLVERKAGRQLVQLAWLPPE